MKDRILNEIKSSFSEEDKVIQAIYDRTKSFDLTIMILKISGSFAVDTKDIEKII